MDFQVDKKRLLKQTGVFFGALLLGLVVSVGAERALSRGTVLSGVVADNRDLSGLAAPEVSKLFEGRVRELDQRKFRLVLKGKELVLTGAESGASIDRGRLTKEALGAGRSGGIFSQAGFGFARLLSDYEVPVQVTVEKKVLGEKVSPWVEKIVEKPRLPIVRYKNELVFTAGAGGSEVDLDALAERVTKAAQSDAEEIEIPLREREPAVPEQKEAERKKQLVQLLDGNIVVLGPEGKEKTKLTPNQLGDALLVEVNEKARDLDLRLSPTEMRDSLRAFLEKLEVPPTEATFEFDRKGAVTIGPSASGKKADLEQLIKDVWAAAKSGKRQVTLNLVIAEPKMSDEEASGLGVKELVSSFVTHHSCCQTRVKNIHNAAAKLNGTVLRPGETFSLNGLLGRRTRASGYFKAPTIVRGKMKNVYGGGISQLATTLFNAVLRGGYEIVQRQPHSVYFSRYPEGHEATVSFPEPDLIFRNDTESGMVIQTQYTQTFIKVLVYGDGEGRVTTVNKSRRYNIVEPPKEYEPSEEMEPEEQKRLRAGQLGWTVRVSRTVKTSDGKKKKEEREVVYNPRPELLRVHPCVIPEGEEGHTGEECPEPEIEEVEEELSEEEYFETD